MYRSISGSKDRGSYPKMRNCSSDQVARFARRVQADDERLAQLVSPILSRREIETAKGPDLAKVVALLKDRASSLPQLADEAMLFYATDIPGAGPIDPLALEGLRLLKERLAGVAWERAAIGAAIKDVVKATGLKMPQLAMPLRQVVTGRTQTPSIDAVLELLGRETVMLRLASHLEAD